MDVSSGQDSVNADFWGVNSQDEGLRIEERKYRGIESSLKCWGDTFGTRP